MLDLIKGIFSGGVVKSVENIASEWIETDLESAEAKVLMVKTLDPNGLMRRELSRRVTGLYTLYIIVTLMLLIGESFGWGPSKDGILAVSLASSKVTGLFLPITTLFGTIVGASFGINYTNAKQGK